MGHAGAAAVDEGRVQSLCDVVSLDLTYPVSPAGRRCQLWPTDPSVSPLTGTRFARSGALRSAPNDDYAP